MSIHLKLDQLLVNLNWQESNERSLSSDTVDLKASITKRAPTQLEYDLCFATLGIGLPEPCRDPLSNKCFWSDCLLHSNILFSPPLYLGNTRYNCIMPFKSVPVIHHKSPRLVLLPGMYRIPHRILYIEILVSISHPSLKCLH